MNDSRFFRFALVAALLCIGWAYIPLKVSVPNERSRVYLTMALVERGEVSIDAEVKRFGKLADIAKRDGHYYCDKAPGTSMLGVPIYWTVRTLQRAFAIEVAWTDRVVLQLLRRFLMLPFALLGLLILPPTLRKLGVSEESAQLTTLAWPLATLALHYAGALYGHHLVAVALLCALWLALCVPSALGLLFAGIAAGLAGLIEYQAAPACVLLALWVAYAFRKQPAAIAAFAIGALPSALALFAYNTAAFGGPLETSYDHIGNAAIVAVHSHGIGGVDTPKLAAIQGLLRSVHRGLFVTAPIMLLVLPGLWLLWKRDRALGLAVPAMLLSYLLFMSGFDNWWAGWSFGPRLLLPLFSVAMIPLALALDRARTTLAGAGITLGLLLLGFAQCLAMRATFFESPDELVNPVFDLALPALQHGLCSPSLASADGACSAQVVPLVLGLCALGFAWWRWSTLALRPRALAALLGLALCAAGLFTLSKAPLSTPKDRAGVVHFLEGL